MEKVKKEKKGITDSPFIDSILEQGMKTVDFTLRLPDGGYTYILSIAKDDFSKVANELLRFLQRGSIRCALTVKKPEITPENLIPLNEDIKIPSKYTTKKLKK